TRSLGPAVKHHKESGCPCNQSQPGRARHHDVLHNSVSPFLHPESEQEVPLPKVESSPRRRSGSTSRLARTPSSHGNRKDVSSDRSLGRTRSRPPLDARVVARSTKRTRPHP